MPNSDLLAVGNLDFKERCRPGQVQSTAEQLLAAQSRAHELASIARSPLVNANDLVTPLLNTLSMLADEYETVDRQRTKQLRDHAVALVARGNPDQRLEHLRSLALAAHARGEFATGLNLMVEAEKLLDLDASPFKVARVTMDRVDMLQQLGDFDVAAAGIEKLRAMLATGNLDIDPLDGLEAIQRQVERRRLLFDLEFQTGLVELGRHHYDEATAAIERAVEHAVRLGQPPEMVRYQLARIALHRGDTRNVGEWLDDAEGVLRQVAPQRLGVVALMRGWTLLLQGDLPGAAVLLEEAGRRASAANDWETNAKASWRLAQARKSADPEAASTSYREACLSIDRARRAPLGYRMDNLYLADKYATFVDAIEWFASQGEGASALEAIELVKSRRLTAALATAHVDATQQPEAAELLAVTRQLDAIALGKVELGTAAIEALEKRRQELIDYLRRNDPRHRNLTLPALDVPALQRCLAELDARSLELFMVDERTVIAVLVTPTALRVAIKAIEAPHRDALDRYVDNLRQEKPHEGYFDISGGLNVGFADLVPGDLVADALAGSRLLVAPHRELHVVPWAALTNDDQRVCGSVAVGVVPCISCVPALASKLTRVPSVQLFGPPTYAVAKHAMPDYERELDALVMRLREDRPMQSRGPSEAAATVSGFLNLLDQRSTETMLLVACHATFDVDEPLRSSLKLADGNIDAATIMLRRTQFEEVVLRACSTGIASSESEVSTLSGTTSSACPERSSRREPVPSW